MSERSLDERPVVGITRMASRDLATPAYSPATKALLRAGARVVYLGGIQDQFPDDEHCLQGGYYEATETTEGPLRVVHRALARVSVGAMLCFRRGYDNGSLPALNDFRVRSLVEAKDRLHAAVPDLGAQTVVVGAGDSPNVTKQFVADLFVIKPATGQRGRAVEMSVSRGDVPGKVERRLHDLPKERLLVQEEILAAQWPDSLEAEDTKGQSRLNCSKSNELRLFWVNGEWTPIARAESEKGFNSGTDKYVAIKPETVPDEAYQRGAEVARAIVAETGVSELALAIDLRFGYRPSSGDTEPHWYLIEGNAREPQPPSSKTFPALSHRIQSGRAAQLVRMASSPR